MYKSFIHHIPELLASCVRLGGLNGRKAHNLPSTRAVGQLCEDLLQLFFPSFHDDDAVQRGALADLTIARMARFVWRLTDQVRRSVRRGDSRRPIGRTPPIMDKFCRALPEVRELLRTDIEAAFGGDPTAWRREEIILSYPFVEAIAIQRLAHVLHQAGAPIIARMMTEWAHSRTGIDIHPGATIGKHFFIDHGTGVVIGETCRIGHHVKIYHGVTLGARSFVKDGESQIVKGAKRDPDVGDHVTIYPNSTILGGQTFIGANSTLGANVFLTYSVPPNSLVAYEEKQEKQLIIREKSMARHEVGSIS